jgi:hypothetical protein
VEELTAAGTRDGREIKLLHRRLEQRRPTSRRKSRLVSRGPPRTAVFLPSSRRKMRLVVVAARTRGDTRAGKSASMAHSVVPGFVAGGEERRSTEVPLRLFPFYFFVGN